MARKYLSVLFLIIVTLVGCQRVKDDPLSPPELIEEPYFMNYYMVLGWENIHKDSEGFQGYNVYISTDPSLVDLPSDDILLEASLVRVRIGADSDTVTVHCSELVDGTELIDLTSFFVHIRSVCNDTVGYGEFQYQVFPAECQIVQPVENLRYDVVSGQDGNPGGGVRLYWDAPLSAVSPDKYVVSSDWEVLDTVYSTEYYVYTPLDEIEVYAVYGREISRALELEFGAIYWENVELWPADDPDTSQANGFGFTDEGNLILVSVSDTNDWQHIDIYFASGDTFASPLFHSPPLNSKSGMISEEQVSGGFYGMDIVPPAVKSNYDQTREVMWTKTYAFWVDYTSNGYSADDRFGKLEVTGAGGSKVVLNIAYQAIGGLRWVVLGGW